MSRGGSAAELIACLTSRRGPRRSPREGASGPGPSGEARAAPSGSSSEPQAPSRVETALATHGLHRLSRFTAPELVRECGLTMGHARRVAAAFALGRSVEQSRIGERPSLKHPSAVARLMAPLLRGLEVEAFHALYLDARHRLKGRVLVGQGTLTSAPVHPREVYGPAVRLAAAAVIVVHNHPSGDPEPSAADREVTERLVGAGVIVGVPLLDHLIWADGAWTSLRESGDWPG